MFKSIKSILLIGIIAITLASCNNYGKEKDFNGVQLFYTENVTEAEADKLGEFLISSGFADGGQKSVQLNKEGGVYQFRMVAKEGIAEDPQYANMAKAYIEELSNEVFEGADVEVHFCDEKLNTDKVIKKD